MDKKLYQLDYILNIDKFQKIQDDLANATGMAVIAIDYTGNPITKHSRCSDFCKTVREDPILGKYCEKCDSRGGLEAARNRKAYIYLCHVGIVDFAIPIIVEEQYLGAIMAGQVITKSNNKLENVVSKKYQLNLEDYPTLRKLYHQLPIMSLEKVEEIAQMIYHLVNYIVGEAVLKNSLYEANLSLQEESKKRLAEQKNEISEIHSINQNKVKLKGMEEKQSQLEEIAKYSILRPALVYIKGHLDEKIYLEEMAYKCNISPSYFGKIFKRETGHNFSGYVRQQKLSAAKEMLENTDQSILNISLNLGFDDCGYFIKLFKKTYGLTPAVYRKQLSTIL